MRKIKIGEEGALLLTMNVFVNNARRKGEILFDLECYGGSILNVESGYPDFDLTTQVQWE
jgi:hypothetical protein